MRSGGGYKAVRPRRGRLAWAAVFLAVLAGPLAAGAPAALVYTGPHGDPDGAGSLSELLTQLRFEVRPFTDLGDLPDLLPGVRLLVLPGTDDDLAPLGEALTPRVIRAVGAWVEGGGGFLGICGGAYLGSRGWWDGGRFWPALDLAPAVGESELEDPAPRVVPVEWEGRSVPLYYQFGPRFDLDPPDPRRPVTVVARYASGRPAALTAVRGRGRAALVGPHPEADRSWISEDLPGAGSWVDSRNLVRALIRELSRDPAP